MNSRYKNVLATVLIPNLIPLGYTFREMHSHSKSHAYSARDKKDEKGEARQ